MDGTYLGDPEVSHKILLFGEGVDLAYEDHSLGCRSDAMRTLSGTQLQHVQRLPVLSGCYGVRCTQSDGTQFFYHYPLFGEFDLCHTSKGISGRSLAVTLVSQHRSDKRSIQVC